MQKILLADDDETLRKTVATYCRHEGFDVIEASDGQETVELCAFQIFGVIILDVMMPRLDGFSACREIRRKHNTPVIMLTALGKEYDKLHGLEDGSSLFRSRSW